MIDGNFFPERVKEEEEEWMFPLALTARPNLNLMLMIMRAPSRPRALVDIKAGVGIFFLLLNSDSMHRWKSTGWRWSWLDEVGLSVYVLKNCPRLVIEKILVFLVLNFTACAILSSQPQKAEISSNEFYIFQTRSTQGG